MSDAAQAWHMGTDQVLAEAEIYSSGSRFSFELPSLVHPARSARAMGSRQAVRELLEWMRGLADRGTEHPSWQYAWTAWIVSPGRWKSQAAKAQCARKNGVLRFSTTPAYSYAGFASWELSCLRTC